MSYEALAHFYDQLTQDVDYAAWADWLETCFKGAKTPVNLVLDLACGTGSLSLELARRGYGVVGVDLSEEMLMEAMEKAAALPEEQRPTFLCQSMDRLDLYGTVDACVCCLDSVNYVTDAALLRRAFRRVHTFLMPGGRFVFDVNTPEKLAAMDGQTFLDETEDVYCVWRADYDKRRRVCTYGFDLFERDAESGRWSRDGEYHEEKAWTLNQLRRWLEQAGFARITLYGDRKRRPPKPGEGRVFFVCEKEQQTAEEFAAAFAKEYQQWERSSES
ncbi:MAG: class I SAM-dependent methyltransferase [Oscillospiraceae bacterium]|nr:class I SAM-dependent methyltransferase [Oscillospiraceae bacterium]